jgi:hypothetical protein
MTTTILTPAHTSRLYRTMWRSIVNEVGNPELADRIMERIVDSHPHLSQVWEENTCRCCKAILTPLNRSEGSAFCDFCHMDMDRDEFYERNVKMYGAE